MFDAVRAWWQKEDPVTENARAYDEASRAYDELLERRSGSGPQPSDHELRAALEKRAAAERAWHKAYGDRPRGYF